MLADENSPPPSSPSTLSFIDPLILEKEKQLLKMNGELQARSKGFVSETEALLKRVALDDYGSLPKSLAMEADLETSIASSRPKSRPVAKKDSRIDKLTKERMSMNNASSDPYDPLDDDELGDGSEIHSQAAFRFLKAKVRVLSEELEAVTRDLEQNQDSLEGAKKTISELEGKLRSSTKALSAAQTQSAKVRKDNETMQESLSKLRKDYESLSKEFEESIKTNKKQSSDRTQRDVKLNRMTEEVERYKKQAQESRQHVQDLQLSQASQVQALMADVKRLEKQKSDLATAFKKQTALVTVLKKQKVHLDASAWLKLTEREFLRNLDWNAPTTSK